MTEQPRSERKTQNRVIDLFTDKARPDGFPEQTAVAAALSDMDAKLSALVARRDKNRDLKQAMMQELLTGRTRLK